MSFFPRRKREVAPLSKKEASNDIHRRVWRAIAIINAMFWGAALAASGFAYEFRGFALLFAIAPFIIFGAVTGGRRKTEFQEEKLPNSELPTPNPSLAPPKEFHIKIIDDAEPFVDQIKSAANVATGALGENLRSMAISIDKVRLELLKQPDKVANVQRLFTYYAPETANLLAARGKAANAGDTQRLGEIDDMLSKLEIAFSQFNSKMEGDDTRAVEIDMKLLSQSLQQDFGKIESKTK